VTTSPYEIQGPPPTGGATQQETAGKPLIVSGIVCLAVGVVLGIVSFVLLISSVVGAVGDQLTADLNQYPGTSSVTLDPGSYGIFAERTDLVPLTADAVAVHAPSGELVPLRVPIAPESVDRPSGEYVEIATFTATDQGTYEVIVSDVGGFAPGSYIVAHELVGSVGGRAWWGLGIAGGGLLVVLGIVLLAIGLTQRRRARQALVPAYPAGGYYPQSYPVQPAGPPPGWYPDPGRPGGRRYWDGTGWTDHTA
jgi:hypothetical protein